MNTLGVRDMPTEELMTNPPSDSVQASTTAESEKPSGLIAALTDAVQVARHYLHAGGWHRYEA